MTVQGGSGRIELVWDGLGWFRMVIDRFVMVCDGLSWFVMD